MNAKWLGNLLLKQRNWCIVSILQTEPIKTTGSIENQRSWPHPNRRLHISLEEIVSKWTLVNGVGSIHFHYHFDWNHHSNCCFYLNEYKWSKKKKSNALIIMWSFGGTCNVWNVLEVENMVVINGQIKFNISIILVAIISFTHMR